MARRSRSQFRWRENIPLIALVAFLVLVFLTGGGSRPDIQSLVILRPAAMLFCGVALLTIRPDHVRANRGLFGFTAAIFGIVLVHAIPLPPSLWNALPGREIVTEIDRAAGLGEVWRPLSLVPSGTWNAFFSLFVPLAVLLLGVQISREGHRILLQVLIGLALLSGLWGLLQAIGDPRGPLYLYRITNNGTAVGLFSNRNHQAILLAMSFPLLAVYASSGIRTPEQARLKFWFVIVAGVMLVPLILVTGSRAGLIVGAIGLASSALLYRKPQIDTPAKRKVAKINWKLPAAIAGTIALGGLTLMMSRAEALNRLLKPDQVEDQRFQVWGPIARMAQDYFPVGSGIGSFAEVYQIGEEVSALSPNYLNHAHNDWLELYLTAGLPGLAILLVAILVFARSSLSAFGSGGAAERETQFGRLGAVLIGILALASLVDYPLRTPSLACVLVLAALWLSFGRPRDRKSLAEADILH